MRCLLTCIVVISLMLCSICKTGESKTSIDCIDTGKHGLRAELRCEIERPIKKGIHWLRPDGIVVMKCNKDNTACSPLRNNSAYIGVVLSPILTSLIIVSFNNLTDAGEWACMDGSLGTKSVCSKISGGYSLTKTIVDCGRTAEEGQRTELHCNIKGTIWSGIEWVHPRGNVLIACDYKHTMCVAYSKEGEQYTSVVRSPVLNTLTIESFNSKTDAGEWICKDSQDRKGSACNVTVRESLAIKGDQASVSQMLGILFGAVGIIVGGIVTWMLCKRTRPETTESKRNLWKKQVETIQQNTEDQEKGYYDNPVVAEQPIP